MVNLRRFRLARSPAKANPHATPARKVPLFPSPKKAVKRKPLSTPSPGPKNSKRQKTSSTSNNWLSSLPDQPDTSRATSIDNSSTPDPSRDPTSNMRTRMNKKKATKELARCRACGNFQGRFINCPECQQPFHFSCLFVEESLEYVEKNPTKWRCPKCIWCDKCSEYIDDPENVQCYRCLKAYHGKCKPKSTLNSIKKWLCNRCQAKPSSNKNSPHGAKLNEVESNLSDDTEMEDEPVIVPAKSNVNAKKKKAEAGEISMWVKRLEHERLQVAENLIEDLIGRRNLRPQLSELDKLSNSLNLAQKSSQESKKPKPSLSKKGTSPKKGIKLELTSNLNSEKQLIERAATISTKMDMELFLEARRLAPKNKSTQKLPQASSTPRLPGSPDPNQWIYLGPTHKFKALYESSYPEPIHSAPVIYVCQFCLRSMTQLTEFQNHMDFCPWQHPPGNEIYREQDISFWEVDGNEETEKNPSKNNNLSCLLTLPSSHRHGYGKLLIDLSYQLSKREHKIGSPEHPLSDLGLLTYRSYWKSVVICYLRKNRGKGSISLKDEDDGWLVNLKKLLADLNMSIPTLQTLPTEVLIILFGYIHPFDLWKNLRSVNKRFQTILTQDSYWLTRIKHKSHVRLSRRHKTNELCSLPERCAAIEDDYRRWKLENGLKTSRSCSQHYATIDAVKLHRTLAGKKLCFSASRDHSILLWDLEKVAQNVEERDCIVAKTEEAHSGWIWGLTLQNDSTFYTSSWDGSFKQWQICESAFQFINRGQTGGEAALSCVTDQSRVFCSTYGGKIFTFDPRINFDPVHISQARRRAPIISLDHEANSNYLHLASENGKVAYLDVRNIRADMNPVKERRMVSHVSSICLAEGTLACCLGNGRIQYIHPIRLTNEAEFSAADGKRVWSCALTPGATVAVSNDYFIKVFSPGLDPRPMASIEIPGHPSKVDYLNGDLVAAAGDGSVCFWLKDQQLLLEEA